MGGQGPIVLFLFSQIKFWKISLAETFHLFEVNVTANRAKQTVHASLSLQDLYLQYCNAQDSEAE